MCLSMDTPNSEGLQDMSLDKSPPIGLQMQFSPVVGSPFRAAWLPVPQKREKDTGGTWGSGRPVGGQCNLLGCVGFSPCKVQAADESLPSPLGDTCWAFAVTGVGTQRAKPLRHMHTLCFSFAQ